MWHFRGVPHFVDRQFARMGTTQLIANRAKNDPGIRRISTFLCGLSERFHKARKSEDGLPVLDRVAAIQVRATLEDAEKENQRIHTVAGSATAMLDEAWLAFGMAPPDRPYIILSAADDAATATATANTNTESKGP